AAVSGMNCAMPCAPAGLMTPGWKPLSWNNNRMKNAAGTSFDCAACVSVSQISVRERWTTGLGTGGSGGGVFAKSAGGLSGIATPPSSENIESSAVSRGLSFSRVLSSLSLGVASADFSLTIEALEKSVSESFGLEPSVLDRVARHRQAGTNKCRIVVCAPEISAALELASEQVGSRKEKAPSFIPLVQSNRDRFGAAKVPSRARNAVASAALAPRFK